MTLKPLLPNEPRIYNLPQESELTVKHLLPVMNDIFACFLALRLQYGDSGEAGEYAAGGPSVDAGG